MMAKAFIGTLAAMLFLLGTPPAAHAEPPLRLDAQIVDHVGLSLPAQVQEAVNRLQADTDCRLYTVFVKSFDGAGGEDWADQAAKLSQLGRRDALLAVAVDDRAYGISLDNNFPLSESVVSQVEKEDVLPHLTKSDFSGAVVGLADGLRRESTPTAANPTNASVIIGVVAVVIAFLLVIAVVVTRDRKRRLSTRPEAVPKRSTKSDVPDNPKDLPEGSGATVRAPDTAPGIFISYRRQDEPNFAGRLYDKLTVRFGRDRVFIDVDSIEFGAGLAARDQRGNRRLDNLDDYVRLEIESALKSEFVRVIPITAEGVPMPLSSQLPEPLMPLARRNAIEMSHSRFSQDSERLITVIDSILKADRSASG